MRWLVLVTFMVLLVVPLGTSSDSQPQSNPYVTSQTIAGFDPISLDPDFNKTTLTRQFIPSFSSFYDVTILEVVFTNVSFDSLNRLDLAITLNDHTVERTISKNKLASSVQLSFLLEDNASLGYMNPLPLTIQVNASFWDMPTMFGLIDPHLSFQIAYLTLYTINRPVAPSTEIMVQEAIVVPFQLFTFDSDSMFELGAGRLEGFLILPEKTNTSHTLNVTHPLSHKIKIERMRDVATVEGEKNAVTTFRWDDWVTPTTKLYIEGAEIGQQVSVKGLWYADRQVGVGMISEVDGLFFMIGSVAIPGVPTVYLSHNRLRNK